MDIALAGGMRQAIGDDVKMQKITCLRLELALERDMISTFKPDEL